MAIAKEQSGLDSEVEQRRTDVDAALRENGQLNVTLEETMQAFEASILEAQKEKQNGTLVITGVKTRSQRNQTCFVCNRKHYPFCKFVRGVCNVCRKKHQPFLLTEGGHNSSCGGYCKLV